MKKIFLIGLLLLTPFCDGVYANTPTEALEISVSKLIAIAGNNDLDETSKKDELRKVLLSEVDFEAISKRVVSKSWKKATEEQKQQFKQQFLTIMVNTYFSLLKDYSNEKVLFLKEQLKKSKYAIVDTQIVSRNKKIPVRYRLIKVDDRWKIYDFIPEGISLVSTYKKNYATILKKKGMQGLITAMSKKEQQSRE